MNEPLFLLHTVGIIAGSLFFLKLGKEALISFICMQGILSNLLVTKQITLFGLDATSSDVFAVGLIISLNLLQEYYGKQVTQRAIWISFWMLFAYLAMTQIHLMYTPNAFDVMDPHFHAIFALMPRLTISSLSVYLLVQIFDAALFARLKKIFHNRLFTVRTVVSLIISQLLDTILFSIFGLYGVVGHIGHVIIVSYAIKLIVICLSIPMIAVTKKFIPTLKQN